MGEAGAGDVDMRRVVVVERNQHPLLFQRRGEIDRLADAAVGDDLAHGAPSPSASVARSQRRPQAFDQAAFAAHGDDQGAFVVVVDDLGQSHALRSRRGDSRLDQRPNARIGEIGDGDLRARREQSIRSSVVVSPTTMSPAPLAARRPESESSNATERPASTPVAPKRSDRATGRAWRARVRRRPPTASGARRGRARRAPPRRWRAARW